MYESFKVFAVDVAVESFSQIDIQIAGLIPRRLYRQKSDSRHAKGHLLGSRNCFRLAKVPRTRTANPPGSKRLPIISGSRISRASKSQRARP